MDVTGSQLGLSYKAQFGFQGVDSAPSREGRSPCIGLLCRLVQWAILVR
jgi:hypothetical protein